MIVKNPIGAIARNQISGIQQSAARFAGGANDANDMGVITLRTV